MIMNDAKASSSASLDELVVRARRLAQGGGRRVLGITGAPGAGKSTLCTALVDALGQEAVLVGMDGFHLANAELVRLGRRQRKGAPDTFDLDGYVALLGRLRSQTADVIYAPSFDRALEESIGSAVPVPSSVPLVITEGNYLLLDQPGWAGVRDLLDEAWFLDVPPSERVDRLLARRRSYGEPDAQAESWVHGVDEANAAVVEPSRHRADLVIRLTTRIGRESAARSRVVFMCGPSGSGKTTYAKELEADGMVRLSFDTEMWRRGVTALPAPREVLVEIEATLQSELLRLVAEHRDVVLDFPFSTRKVRDDYRQLLAPTGVVPETIYLATNRDVVLQRLAARRDGHGDDLRLGDRLAQQHFDEFEVPTPQEGPLTVVRPEVAR